MKPNRLILVFLGCLISAASLFAARQNEAILKGSVQDPAGEPLGFATVYLSANGSIVTGTAIDETGLFTLKTAPGTYTLTVALIGYKDASRSVELKAGEQTLDPIRLEEDTVLLEGSVLSVIVPKTKLTGEGLQTNIRGSVLENAGNASDVLAKTPGMIKGQNGLEVIGKGAPLVYINGHKVTDMSELERLQSNEIQSVEVISNPGAQYDATVRSVVRIKTVKRQGDGFGFSVDASDQQSLRWNQGNDPFAAVNANYRTGGLDFFAGFNYAKNTSRQDSDADKISYGKNTVTVDDGDLIAIGKVQSIYGNGGVNWQMADNHFLGGKIEWGRRLQNYGRTDVWDIVSVNGTKTDDLTTVSVDEIGDMAPYNLGANVYYNGLVGEKLGIDVNLDYYGTQDSSVSDSAETSPMTEDAAINSDANNDAKMYAAKAVLSYPLWMGQLQAGTEESYTRRTDVYHISGINIPASDAEVKENNIAGFASYGMMHPKIGMLNAGVRYEYVRYSYSDSVSPENNLSRDYGHWFPTVSYATALGPVQLMLNYSAKTERPRYAHLSSVVRYNSRYIWQSGNAMLQPELSNDLSATAIWKFFTFVVNYTRTDDAIMTWSIPQGDEGVVLVQPKNIETPYRNLAAYVNLTPTIGNWNLNYTFGVQPQWLSIDVEDPREESGVRKATFNGKPVWIAQLNNTLTVKGGWQFELGAMLLSKGYTENMYLYHNYFDLTAAVQKTLLRDGSLVLRLEGKDLTGQACYDVRTDFGSHRIVQTNFMDTQRIKFSLRYSFNSAQSKYRGTGAGSDNKGRM